MQSEAERTLRNLSIVGLLKQNDKLMTLADTFAISTPTSYRGAYRKWLGEERMANLTRVGEAVRAGCAYVTAAREEQCALPLQRQRLELSAQRMAEALARARVGLRHLGDTYADDSTCRVRIELLVQEVDDFLRVLGEFPASAGPPSPSSSSSPPPFSSSSTWLLSSVSTSPFPIVELRPPR